MDRTSILGDTIDYMKELLERINHLQEEEVSTTTNQIPNLMGIFKDSKPNEALVRNSPKVRLNFFFFLNYSLLSYFEFMIAGYILSLLCLN